MTASVEALLLDVGGVLIRTPFEMLDLTERARGLPAGTLGPRGPFTPAQDPEFAKVRDGRLAEREYWARRAARAAPLLGIAPDTRSLMTAIFDFPADQVVRPQARALVAAAQAAGHPVGILTNDLLDFHGRAWVERMAVFDRFDFTVDGSITGVLKPDLRAYHAAVQASGGAAEQLLFLDDQPVNIAGAQAAGLPTVLVDVTRPEEAFEVARRLLRL